MLTQLKSIIIFVCLGLLLHGVQCEIYKRFYPETNVERIFVEKKNIPWSKPNENYNPPTFTSPCEDECDPLNTTDLIFNAVDNGTDRRSIVKKYKVMDGVPLNPRGRTGVAGRGSLQRWGPNHLVMLIITKGSTLSTALVSNTNGTQKLTAFPAEFVKGPTNGIIPPNLLRLLKEDLGRSYHAEIVDEIIKESMKKCAVHFRGYFPDERNTDNAWTELTMIEIQDEKVMHLGNLKFDDPSGPLIWRTFPEGVLKTTIKSLLERSKLTIQEKAKCGLKTAVWSMKSQGISWLAEIISDVLSHSVTITGIAMTVQDMMVG
uniref:ADP-ribose pyrophosphatase, mitochondrial n=1 Tax=Trichuris muris TaxID=70415 RepID=A0A5S6R237_TRIMR